MSAHVNVRIPRFGEHRDRLEREKRDLEAKFWEKATETLVDELRNIFDFAKENGHIELWLGDEKLELVVPSEEASHD